MSVRAHFLGCCSVYATNLNDDANIYSQQKEIRHRAMDLASPQDRFTSQLAQSQSV